MGSRRSSHHTALPPVMIHPIIRATNLIMGDVPAPETSLSNNSQVNGERQNNINVTNILTFTNYNLCFTTRSSKNGTNKFMISQKTEQDCLGWHGWTIVLTLLQRHFYAILMQMLSATFRKNATILIRIPLHCVIIHDVLKALIAQNHKYFSDGTWHIIIIST